MLILLYFFLSGATGLVYQVVWLRLLGLAFGHTVFAITTVLAAFMAGLALGSWLLGRRARRIGALISAYGWMEVGIGVYCAMLPWLLEGTSALYLAIHRHIESSHVTLGVSRFLLAFVPLLVPTTLMGGTLPVLSQALVRHPLAMGRTVGLLYAVNTAGAVMGVALAGYLLIPLLGNRLMTLVAAAANLAVGVAALASARLGPSPAAAQAPRVDEPAAAEPGEPGAEDRVPGARVWLMGTALGLSGAASMIYEIAWTRALALVIGSSTYAFTAMLVAFLAGIAGGSALYSWLRGKQRSAVATFGALQGAIGIASMLAVLLFERLPELYLTGLDRSDAPAFVQAVQVAVSVCALLPATLVIGATFPCAVAAVARPGDGAAERVGRLYASNTAGAILGTLAGGFLLIPALGLQASIRSAILVNLVLGIVLLAMPAGSRRPWRWGALAAGAAAVVLVPLLPRWDPGLMSSGPAIYGKRYLRDGARAGLKKAAGAAEVLYYRDGLSATVAVYRDGQQLFLRVNGKTDASTGQDMPTQLLLAHLPMLVHPAPRSALVIGLGSGITAGATARHPVERLDVVEIEPAVVEAARFFSGVHGGVLDDPRLRLIVADGRNFLLTTPHRYDVIISEPSNPWISGLASLFSVEFFEAARARLAPGGLMVQWLHGYNLFPDDVRMIVRTFRAAFPATTVWNTTTGDFLLLGSRAPLALDLARIAARHREHEGVAADFRRLGLEEGAGLLGFFMLREADTARFAGGGALNTDDRLPLEFSAPRALYVDTAEENRSLMRSFSLSALPALPALTDGSQDLLARADTLYWIGMGALGRNAPADALPHFHQALAREPGHVPSLLALSATYLRLGRAEDALRLALAAARRDPRSARALFLAGLASAGLGAASHAVGYLEGAAAIEPANPRIRHALNQARLDELRGGSGSGLDEGAAAPLPRR